MSTKRSKRVAFLHPDLGIGGAERLIVNYAVALQQKGHQVEIFTQYHNKLHCFPETVDGTLRVSLRLAFIPKNIFGAFTALLSYLKMFICAVWMLLFEPRFDVYVVDEVSFPVLLFRLANRPVIFYCHFPDQLLCGRRDTALQRAYRVPLDHLERISTLQATRLIVNSEFTRETTRTCFKMSPQQVKEMIVVYPPVDCQRLDTPGATIPWLPWSYFISISRYDPAKNVAFALHTFKEFSQKDTRTKLVLVGGCDPKNPANTAYFDELSSLAAKLALQDRVILAKNLSDTERNTALKGALGLIYTPTAEHFGIVPVEAMYLRVPVLAFNNGGPRETVVDGETGFLLDDDAAAWAEKMELLQDEDRRRAMGEKGRQRAIALFSMESFGQKVDEILLGIE